MSYDPSFIHLQVHSEYSIFDSVLKIDQLIEACVKHEMPAVALTDLSNMFALVKFHKKATSSGIKPIFGSEVWVKREARPARFLVLCMNNTGLNELRVLLSRGYREAHRDPIPLLEQSWLYDCKNCIVILLEDPHVVHLLDSNDEGGLESSVQALTAHFPNQFYIGLMPIESASSGLYDANLKIAQRFQLPVVATHPVCFLSESDFDAHEARVCIQEGMTLNQPRKKLYYPEQYFKSSTEMAASFANIPSALKNTVEIAKRCNVTLKVGKAYLPDFPVPENETVESFLEKEALLGLEKKSASLFKSLTPEERAKKEKSYKDRLILECEVINSMGFAGYFMIVADFIRWAKSQDIPVGPGRGSGAGSLVAFALDITGLDPIQYELLFERFLNPERISMPDFDIDFCMDKRDLVIDYVAEKYGRESVSQIATFGTMAAKAVVRDVGRVLGHPYGFVDRIAKLIPFELGITLDKALTQEEALNKLYKTESEVKTLIDLARKLEGTIRNVGKHAGGVVIAPSLLTDFTPLYCEEGNTHIVSQFDKDDVEAIGLVKFDFLGLRTLTIIQWATQFANVIRAKEGLSPLCIEDIPLDDQKAFEHLKKCETTAVFQLESRGMKELIQRLKPDNFEEIIALVALFRPGPLQSGMVDDFINRKHGREPVAYLHPSLEVILKPTYGVILYQEQVMQIAQTLSGFTLGGADLLRRAMGKKKLEEMAELRATFVKGAEDRGVDAETATRIFDLIEKFAGYGFNKSHSAAYALISYQTAWLKAHYPNAFMAAVLSSDMTNTDKLVVFVGECKQMGLKLMNPNINESEFRFTLNAAGDILYGLGAIKGLGEGAVESIVEGRKISPYEDLFDFCQRVDLKKVNRRSLEALIKSGCFDTLGKDRATLMTSLEVALHTAEKQFADKQSGQGDLFSIDKPEKKWVNSAPWDDLIRLKAEKDTLGLYISGHPIVSLQDEFRHFVTHSLKDVNRREGKFVLAGIISQMRTLQTKKGDRMAFIALDDSTAVFEVAVFADLYEKRRAFITKDELIIVSGVQSTDKFSKQLRFRAEEILDLPHARAKYAKRLRLTLKNQPANEFDRTILGLKNAFSEERGHCSVVLEYQSTAIQVALNLGEKWGILPSDEFLNKLKNAFGKESLKLEYENPEV